MKIRKKQKKKKRRFSLMSIRITQLYFKFQYIHDYFDLCFDISFLIIVVFIVTN